MSASFARARTLLAIAALAVTAPLSAAAPALAHNHGGDMSTGGVVVSQPFARATMPGARVAAAYLQVRNTGRTPVTLVSAASPVCEKVELHTMSMDGGVMRMREVQGGVTIQPGGTVIFAPGGLHLMLLGLRQQLTQGTTVPITLNFRGAASQTLAFPVQAMGATDGHHHH